jgi:amidohydrolase
VPGNRHLVALLSALDAHLDDAVTLRRQVHANPELGNEEHKTAARVQEALEAWVEPEPVLATGVIVRVGDQHEPAVGLRAELDALPLVEATGATFAATNGRMHACGHDVHLAALVAVCRAAADVGVSRPLVGIFQPSEERYPSGAQQLVEEGALSRHRLGAMLAVHLHPEPGRGAVAVGNGPINASSDEFEVVVEGEGGHGAYPHHARDPVVALSHCIVALQHVVSRRVDPIHSAVLGVGTIQADGAPNIVPSLARARGTLRCLQDADRRKLQAIVREVVEHTSRAHDCRATVEFIEGEPALVNEPTLLAHVEHGLRAIDLRVDPPMRSCGADDFGFYSESVPSAMLFLGIGDSPGLHNPRFLPPDDAVRDTARALVACYAGGCSFLDAGQRPHEGADR